MSTTVTVKTISNELEFIRRRVKEMLIIPRLQSDGLIPIRITHNDTKFNNIIFDDEGKAVCVVDLDTVMPGSVLFDYGDAIRSVGNTSFEDEQDLNKISLNLDIFESFTRGYLEGIIDLLNSTEIEMLAFSARYITFLMGLRFLTDYLDGDIYYRTQYAEHNLVRARAQFKLVESMEVNFDQMNEIVKANALRTGKK